MLRASSMSLAGLMTYSGELGGRVTAAMIPSKRGNFLYACLGAAQEKGFQLYPPVNYRIDFGATPAQPLFHRQQTDLDTR